MCLRCQTLWGLVSLHCGSKNSGQGATAGHSWYSRLLWRTLQTPQFWAHTAHAPCEDNLFLTATIALAPLGGWRERSILPGCVAHRVMLILLSGCHRAWFRHGCSILRSARIHTPNHIHRRKFRSQTSDNMDRWKSRGGQSQRREEKRRREKISEEKESEERRCTRAKKVEKSRFTVVFSTDLWLRRVEK